MTRFPVYAGRVADVLIPLTVAVWGVVFLLGAQTQAQTRAWEIVFTIYVGFVAGRWIGKRA